MEERDGSRDFDFLFGDWDFQLRRLLHPLSGSNEWARLEGTLSCRPIWGGRANLDEVTLVNPQDGTKIVGLTLRLYDPATHLWSLYWANAKDGKIAGTPQKGRFVDGRGEFFDRDVYEGKEIVIRYVWSDISANSAHFEQAFSSDGGKSWETNWITDQKRRPNSNGGPSVQARR
jgi:hypothetical protein